MIGREGRSLMLLYWVHSSIGQRVSGEGEGSFATTILSFCLHSCVSGRRGQ